MTDSAVRSAWRQQAIWSALANRLKRGLTRSRRWMLGLMVGGAVLETAAAQVFASAQTAAAIAGAAGAAALAAAAFIRVRGLALDRVRDWVRARSASEGLKKAVFLHLMRASTEPLPEAVERILGAVRDLEPQAALISVPDREPPGPLSLAQYVEVRVNDQIERFYRPRAAALARRLAATRRGEFALLLAAAAIGALGSLFGAARTAAWVAVLTTIAGTLLAEAEAARYTHLIISYRTTARRLETLRDRWRELAQSVPLAEDEIARFVRQCEEAISIENQAWMAEWIKES